jgi:hypothetical protein
VGHRVSSELDVGDNAGQVDAPSEGHLPRG